MKGKQPGGNLRPVNWSRTELEPFQRDFYHALPHSKNADRSVVEKFRHEHEITIVKGRDQCPNPIFEFEDGGFPDYIMKAKSF